VAHWILDLAKGIEKGRQGPAPQVAFYKRKSSQGDDAADRSVTAGGLIRPTAQLKGGVLGREEDEKKKKTNPPFPERKTTCE